MNELRAGRSKVYARLRDFAWRNFPRPMLVWRYARYFGRIPALWRPRTLTGKVLHRLLFDRDPQLTFFADKVDVREYVIEKLGGSEHLTTLYAVIDEPSEIHGIDLPAAFVMKPNHLSRAVRIVRNGDSVDRTELAALAASWLRRNYYEEMGEWAYRDIMPRVMFEELLQPEGGTPVNYKFHCFHGEPRFLVRIAGPHDGPQTLDMYDMNFQPYATITRELPHSVPQPTVPLPNFAQMVDISRKLSAGVGYLRVDLYNIAGRIVFGELTNYPAAGLVKYVPREWDRTFGDYWRSE